MKKLSAILFFLAFLSMHGQAKKTFGKDIYALIGKEMNPRVYGNRIDFDQYSVNDGGGHLMDTGTKDEYAVNYLLSDKELFYVFEIRKQGAKYFRVLDILAINKKEASQYMVITSFCETAKGADSGIIALVNDKDDPEYYTKIVKAWRANPDTGKFEPMKPNQVKRCSNEGYGAGDE